MTELLNLELDYIRAKYPHLPYPIVRPYEDKTANGLTRCIIRFLQLKGYQAERISVTGRTIGRQRVVTDCIGFKRTIGSTDYIPSTMTKGSADISATVQGRSVKIEVKIGKDRQSDHQRKYQDDVERAGGIYIIATGFEQFTTELRRYFTI